MKNSKHLHECWMLPEDEPEMVFISSIFNLIVFLKKKYISSSIFLIRMNRKQALREMVLNCVWPHDANSNSNFAFLLNIYTPTKKPQTPCAEAGQHKERMLILLHQQYVISLLYVTESSFITYKTPCKVLFRDTREKISVKFLAAYFILYCFLGL